MPFPAEGCGKGRKAAAPQGARGGEAEAPQAAAHGRGGPSLSVWFKVRL